MSCNGERRIVRIDCELRYDITDRSDFIFLLHAERHERQHVLDESLAIEPALPHRIGDHDGKRLLRLNAGPGPLALRYRALVELRPPEHHEPADRTPIDAVPDAVLGFLLPSRYCESHQLGTAARQLFGGIEPGSDQVRAISDWIGTNIEYRPGSTDSGTTATDVVVRRTGVCRDFAHLGIAFCRALDIPARMVSGYAALADAVPDFHAVFEAWIGGRWLPFDATGLAPVDELVRIASGRDAGDVAFATLYGSARCTLVRPCVERVSPATPDGGAPR